MEGKHVPWWRKALNFALTGIRTGFGLLARTAKEEASEPGTPGVNEEINKEHREEAELTEKFLEQIPHVILDPVEEPIADLRSDAPVEHGNDPADEIAALEVELNADDPVSEPVEAAVAVLVESETAQASVDYVHEEAVDAIAEPMVESVLEAGEIVASESAAPEITLDAIEATLTTADLKPEPVVEVHSHGPQSSVGMQPESEPVPEQVGVLAVPFENESVDEMASQPEAAISEVAVSEAVSPVLESLAEPAMQPECEAASADSVDVTVEQESQEPALEPEDPIEADQAGQSIELTNEEENDKINIAEAAGVVEAEQTTADQMDVNQTNPEPAEENVPAHEAPPETALPVTAQEAPAPPQDASAPADSDEPEAPANVTIAAQHPAKPFIKRESPEDQANASPFSVIVSQVYDGPLDLLLDLIRKQDIDIYDIPIARITAQFLAYVDKLKATDVDVAGEFIYTASLLIHIKSKMLLPRAPSGPEDAAEDPRRELVERLLEHERFKNAAQMLQQKQMLEAATWTNPGVRDFKEDAGAEPEIAADTVDLVRVFRDILDRARNRPVLNVEEDSVTVGQMIQFLSRRLNMEDKPVALRRLLSHTRSERALIAMFLALLELVRLQAILLRQDRAFSEIFIKKHTGFETVMNQGVAQDDWK